MQSKIKVAVRGQKVEIQKRLNLSIDILESVYINLIVSQEADKQQ